MEVETHILPAAAPGTNRQIKTYSFGKPGHSPKVYIQAALHANELPGIVVADHLIKLLEAEENAGHIKGEVVVVPMANPIGLDQVVDGVHLGRFDLPRGRNFNRFYPDFADQMVEALKGKLGKDQRKNLKLIRHELKEMTFDVLKKTQDESDALRHNLYWLACDADYVLDLHCDWDAIMHLYTSDACWDDLKDLSALLGSEANILCRQSGGNPFDEAISGFWTALSEKIDPRYPIGQAGKSCTIELRGEADVSDELAAGDAAAILDFLKRRHVVKGETEGAPLPPIAAPTPLEGVDMVSAPCCGIVVYNHNVGDRVKKGDILGYVINPHGETGEIERVEFKSQADGIVYGRILARLVRPGDVICKVAGGKALAGRAGNLLTDK